MKKQKYSMRKNNILVNFSTGLIKGIWHGKFGRKLINKKGIRCRFYPTCSDYSIKVLEKHGFFKGWILTIKRIKRCNFKNTETCVDYP